MYFNNPTVKIEFDANNLQRPENGPFQITRDKTKNAPLYSKTGHWSDKENVKYYAFLSRFREKFEEKQMRRQWKVFKTLSEFVKTRNPNQCRSHHHKMQKDFSSIEQTLSSLRRKIPDIQKKSEKYSELLDKIIFSSTINMSQYKPTEIPIQQYIKPVEKNDGVENQMIKKQGVENMRTGLTYEDAEEKNKYYPQEQDPRQYFQHQNYYDFNQYNYFYGMGAPEYYNMNVDYSSRQREQKVIECHQYFLRWWNKLTSLMKDEQLSKGFSNSL